MGFSPIHIVMLAVVAILVLGGGRFSSMMGDVAKGIKNFKHDLAEPDEPSERDRAPSLSDTSPPVDARR